MSSTSNGNANTHQSTNSIPSHLASTQNNLAYLGPATYPSSTQVPIQPELFSPSVFAPFQYGTNTVFPNQSTQLDPTRSGNPLTTDPTWNTTQNPIPDLGDGDLVNNSSNGPEALSDAPWALLASGGWESWQGLNFMP